VSREPFNILFQTSSQVDYSRRNEAGVRSTGSFVAKILLYRDSTARYARAIDVSRRANI